MRGEYAKYYNLPIVLYGCELSLTAREELRLSVFENGMPRRIFGLRRYKVTKVQRKAT